MIQSVVSVGKPRPSTRNGLDQEVTISAALAEIPVPDPAALRSLRGRVDWLEVRADLIGDPDPGPLRANFGGRLQYSLRGLDHGGQFTGTTRSRRARLLAAANRYDLVDLESDLDLVPELLDAIPPERRRISWHGPAMDLPALRRRAARMTAVPARLYLIAPRVQRAEQALDPLLLLKELDRADVTAFGTGSAGTWSRLLAPWLGAPVVYTRDTDTADTGIPGLAQLADYGFPALPLLRELYGIAGGTVTGSLSPRLHNAAYRAIGLPALYLPFQVDSLLPFWSRMAEAGLPALGLPLRAATIKSPHKEDTLRMSLRCSDAARNAGSANALVRYRRGWHAHTSDSLAVVEALNMAGVPIAGTPTAVIGCGGAGRAAAAGLVRAGARVTLVNRTESRGRDARRRLGLPFTPLAEFSPRPFSLVVHATPLATEIPIDLDELAADATVLDFVYSATNTALAVAARRRGLTVIDGWDMLLAETISLFQVMTGRPAPVDDIRSVLDHARPVPPLR